MLFAVDWIRWKRESRRLARAEKRFVTSGAHSHVGTSLFLAGVAALAVIAWLLASTPARPQLVDVADPPAATRSALDEWPSMTEPDAAATPSRDSSPATTSANQLEAPPPTGTPSPEPSAVASPPTSTARATPEPSGAAENEDGTNNGKGSGGQDSRPEGAGGAAAGKGTPPAGATGTGP